MTIYYYRVVLYTRVVLLIRLKTFIMTSVIKYEQSILNTRVRHAFKSYCFFSPPILFKRDINASTSRPSWKNTSSVFCALPNTCRTNPTVRPASTRTNYSRRLHRDEERKEIRYAIVWSKKHVQ